MTVTVEKPKIVMLMYRQERSDEDYGSCLWARFNFDLKHYSMTIESDCGNYSYGWTPTPDSESFLQLCARFNWEYLLGKISNQTVIDGNATFQKVKELMEQIDEDVFASIDEVGMEEIESACTGLREDTEAYMAICSILGEYGFSEYDSYDVACCIEKDYPLGAKKIAQIYRDHIQPVVRKLAKEDAVEVVHGRWVMKETMIRSPFAKNAYCSVCLEETANAHNYCPNCGAKMDGERKDNG